MSCRKCGCPTQYRVCRQCDIEQRAEERAKRRLDEDDDDEEGTDPVPLPDGGRPAFIDPRTEWVECYHCGATLDPEECDGVDVSDDDEYYPRMKPVCPGEHRAPRPDGGTEHERDRARRQVEARRQAKQAALTFLTRCEQADADPEDILDDVREKRPPDSVMTDGGRAVHPADAALAPRGVGDQERQTCPNGDEECAKSGTAPCFACLTGGDE